MSIDDLHPLLCEALALHAILLKQGVSPDDVFVFFAEDKMQLSVAIAEKNTFYTIDVGEFPTDGAENAWMAAVTAYNTLSQPDRERLVNQSRARNYVVEIASGLYDKGFRRSNAEQDKN